jgi:type I site-specific restriction-modification system R (restriction) subunit
MARRSRPKATRTDATGSLTLEAERESLKEVVLAKRLARALKKLNPWLSDDNIHKAVRAVTGVQAPSLPGLAVTAIIDRTSCARLSVYLRRTARP